MKDGKRKTPSPRADCSREVEGRDITQAHPILKAAIEAAPEGILVIDDDRVFVGNEAFLRMWDLSPEAIEGQKYDHVLMLVAQKLIDPEAFSVRAKESYQTPSDDTKDLLHLIDGRIIECCMRAPASATSNAGGTWYFRDITEQRRTEEELRDETYISRILYETGKILASELDLEKLLQTMTDAATKISGAEFGSYFYNARNEQGDVYMLYTLSGASREAFANFGQPRPTQVFGPTFRGEKVIRSDDILKDPRYGKMAPHYGMPPGHLPVRSYLAVPVISRSGEVFGGLFFGHPKPGRFTEHSERIIGAIAVQAAIAIDNARLFEGERAARDTAEQLGEIKDNFLANLSHELRTPLSAILGWTQVLQYSAKSPADLQNGLETIERNCRAQVQLVDDLLDTSRISSGKVRLDIQQLSPISIIEAALETVRPAVEGKGIRLIKLLDSMAGPISGDPARLQQVMWNLLSNAIKFTPKGGRIQITLERINSHIEISVVDSGIGIKPDLLPHIFDRFQQGDSSTTKNFAGLGLGLSIVKQFIELHGGTVKASSQGEGKGAVFTLHLPLTALKPQEDRAHPQAFGGKSPDFKSVDLSGLAILVVDDESDARYLIKRVLADCSAEVKTAASGDEALSILGSAKPDILISDIGMPEMDGYELLKQIRALDNDWVKKIPAIALTAFARSEDRTKALRAGFLAHIAKPVEPSELVATVAVLVGRNQ